MPAILCGLVFKDPPVDQQEKAIALNEVEEKFRIFYETVEEILTLEKEEERARQVTEAADG